MQAFQVLGFLRWAAQHKEQAVEIIDAAQRVAKAQSFVERADPICEIVKAAAPIADELVAAMQEAERDGLGADQSHEGLSGAAGLNWSTVEQVLPLVFQALQLLLAIA